MMGKVMGCFQGENLPALSSKNSKLSGFELDASADAVFKNDAFTPVMYCVHLILTSSL